MRYLDFRNSITRALFSGSDVDVVRSGVHSLQMNRWVKKGYITRIRRDLFIFTDRVNEVDRRAISFRLYEPSYVSMETVLAQIGLIPEVVHVTTCVSTRTTRTFETTTGVYTYRHLQDALFWGYTIVDTPHGKYVCAEPEKALLDYIYFNTHRLRDSADIESLRINPFEFAERINVQKLREYAARFNMPTITRVVEMFITNLSK